MLTSMTRRPTSPPMSSLPRSAYCSTRTPRDSQYCFARSMACMHQRTAQPMHRNKTQASTIPQECNVDGSARHPAPTLSFTDMRNICVKLALGSPMAARRPEGASSAAMITHSLF